MKRKMKWIMLGIGAFILIAVIAVLIFWRVAQQNVRDKGGMENPYYTGEITSSIGENNTDKISETAKEPE